MNAHVKPETEHSMQIMGHEGHTTVTWNPDIADSIAAARREFTRLIREGYRAFRMDPIVENGVIVERKSDQIMREFDPTVGKVMMVPHLVGG